MCGSNISKIREEGGGGRKYRILLPHTPAPHTDTDCVAYYNFYGANFDGSNQVPAKAPGKLDYNNVFTSSGFFGVQPQDMPAVCLMPAVEFHYSSVARGQQHTNWTNGDNTNFTVFNPSVLIYTSTTTTTTKDMLGGVAGGGMEGGASSVTTTTTATRSTSSLLPVDVIGPKRIVIQNKAHLGPFKTFIGSHRYGLNITVGTLNRPCQIIFHKDNYVRCVHPATDTVSLRSPYNPLLTAPITQNGFEINPRQVVLHNINVESEKGGMNQRQSIKIHGRSTEGVTSAGIKTPDDASTRRKLEDHHVEDHDDRILAGISWVNSPDVLARLRALEEQKAQGLPSDFDLLRITNVRRGLLSEDEDADAPDLLTLPEYAGGLPYYGEDIDGQKDSRLWDLDRGIVAPIIPEERELWFLDVKIRICPPGMVRGSAGAFKCFPCPKGQYSLRRPLPSCPKGTCYCSGLYLRDGSLPTWSRQGGCTMSSRVVGYYRKSGDRGKLSLSGTRVCLRLRRGFRTPSPYRDT